MTSVTCEQLSDRMHAVATGQSTWSDAELRHLETCEACRAEYVLVEATARLGADVRPNGSADDVAGAVLARVRATEKVVAERQRMLRRWQVGLAAAAATVVAVFLWRGNSKPAVVGVTNQPAAAVELIIPLAELDSADSTEMTAVLRVLDDGFDEKSTLESVRPSELEDDDYARALRAMEG